MPDTPETPPAPPATPTPDPSQAAQLEALKAREEAARTEAEAAKAALIREREAREKLERQEQERQAKQLAEEGKYKELADQERQRREAAEAAVAAHTKGLDAIKIDSEVRVALIREGIIDDALAVLVDKSNIRVENGQVVGVKEAVAKLKTEKPPFFGTPGSRATGPTHNPLPATENPTDVPDFRGLKGAAYEKAKNEFLQKRFPGAARTSMLDQGRFRRRFG